LLELIARKACNILIRDEWKVLTCNPVLAEMFDRDDRCTDDSVVFLV